MAAIIDRIEDDCTKALHVYDSYIKEIKYNENDKSMTFKYNNVRIPQSSVSLRNRIINQDLDNKLSNYISSDSPDIDINYMTIEWLFYSKRF